MNVFVTLEHRFYLFENDIYTDGAFNSLFWQRYLNVFEKITIVARAKEINKLESKYEKVNNERISFHAIPFYIGPKDKVLKTLKVKKSLREISNDRDSAYILRVGSPIADVLSPILLKNKIEYAVEVVGDPWDVFAPGAFNSPLRPFMRLYFSWKLKKQCLNSSYSSYVTEFALQNRYPSPNAKYSIHASSIELKESFFAEKDQTDLSNKKWLFVGTLEQYQKAPDILIQAFNEIKDPSISLTIIGDGRMRDELESMSTNLNVNFIGKLKSSNEVREFLKSHSYFVLPSRGEGLPRAMIEAMACSCVCVGSDIGGIKELIKDEFIVKAGSVVELRDKIIEVSNKEIKDLYKESERNKAVANEYLSHKLETRRNSFYEAIKNRVVKK